MKAGSVPATEGGPLRGASRRLTRYILGKVVWYVLALVLALVLNFLLPRLIPGNPVDALIAQYIRGGSAGQATARVYQAFLEEFGLDRSMGQQFVAYIQNVLRGNLGVSFAFYPAKVADLIAQALPWTVALQLPAILLGWILGNVLGALAAYKGGRFDRAPSLWARWPSPASPTTRWPSSCCTSWRWSCPSSRRPEATATA